VRTRPKARRGRGEKAVMVWREDFYCCLLLNDELEQRFFGWKRWTEE